MSLKSADKIQHAHDQFFRTVMSDRRVASEFLRAHLPHALCVLIDFDHLKVEPRHYANEVRQESIVGVLFKSKLNGNDAYLFLLLEHQSTPDELMPFL